MTIVSLRSRNRVRAFTRRAWIQQSITTIWIATLVGGAFGVIVFLDSGGMNALASMPDLIPNDPDGLVAVSDADGEFLPVTSYLLTMTPAMLGTLVALVATLTLPGVVADDVSNGGIEVLLAGPIPRQRLFSSYLGAALVMTGVAWSIAMLAFTIAAVITSTIVGATVSLSLTYSAALVVIPLSMGVWSATATLFGALLYPNSLDSKAGLNGGPIRLVAMLPALVAVPSVLFLPECVMLALGAILVVTLLASFLVIRLTARGFRSTRVLGN